MGWEDASSKATSPEHFKQLMNEPGNYKQRDATEAYREGWDRIFANKEEEEEENA